MEVLSENEIIKIYGKNEFIKEIANDLIKEIENKKNLIYSFFDIKEYRQVNIFLYDNLIEFKNYIESKYNVKLPSYCKGTIQLRKYFLYNK